MDGKVRPVGELVRPLPSLAASRKRAKSAARPAPTRPAALPVVPLAAGGGGVIVIVIVIVLGAGWLGLRRRRRPATADPSGPPQRPPA